MIKAFNDGNRFCLVIEDCPEELKQQLIKQLSPTLLGDLEAKPMVNKGNTKTEEVLENNQQEPLLNNELEKLYGAMTILTEFKAPDEMTDSAFKCLADQIGLLPKNDKASAGSLLKKYLSIRFDNANADLFMGMKNGQYKSFFNIFGSAIGPVMWERNKIAGVEDFLQRPQEEKDNFMREVLSCFASAYKKR